MGILTGRRLHAVIALLAFMLLLSACMGGGSGSGGGGGGGGGKTDSTNNTNESDADKTPPSGSENRDPVELTIHAWYISPSIQATIDLFQQKYPWITVKHNGSINQYIINNIIAGEDSDIIFLDAGLSPWISGGNDLLEELTPYIEKDERVQNATLVEGVLESQRVGDRIYTMPYTDVPMWIGVNKDLLHQYGLEMPSLDWTYDEMLEMAKVATDPNNNTWGMYGTTGWFLHTLPVANGHAANFYLMGEGNLKSVADTPEVIADLQWLQDLVVKWNVHPNEDQIKEFGLKGDHGAAFADGNILFAPLADWNLTTMKRAQFDWDILPFPRGKKRQVTYRHFGAMAITKASKDKEEAFMFMSFLFSEEAQKVMIENGSAAWVLTPELEKYYDEVPIWEGRNTEVVRMSARMGQYSAGPSIMNLVEYQDSVMARIHPIINKGGNFSDIIPYVEKYNQLAAETRAAIGL